MPALLMALRALGPILLNLLLSLLSERFLKGAIYRVVKYGADRYKAKADATADKSDDSTAALLEGFARDLQVAFKIEF